jgi:hypothetical protein
VEVVIAMGFEKQTNEEQFSDASTTFKVGYRNCFGEGAWGKYITPVYDAGREKRKAAKKAEREAAKGRAGKPPAKKARHDEDAEWEFNDP